ncbi:Gfo/Idh/MocA family protein [Paludibacter jiangxiensis]|uniref:Predicted dehydrogenase n=1 Tax=Paludibacter jiangxiensis TaxID=681398 RepID=A0A171ARS6_9BACT|nr:Gfo/Idh/MocA family oxidoreductase [Paludibacter jiangxiensis]GAT64171.1 predicted dehydrogenase [Paludibacter jiangxiensis]
MKNTIKWGILGTGWIARKFADALQVADNCELYAVGSRTNESANHFAADYQLNVAYGSYEELVKDPQVDVVYIATPHNLHLENTLLALDNGKHVLCEKPMGVNEQEVIRMIATAKEKNLFLMEALWSRFLPHIIKTRELIESGAIGAVNLLTATFCVRSENGPEHRHYNVDLCGGTILDIGIYNIFLSLFLFGKPENVSAVATLSDQGIDTNCSYSFTYPENKLSVMYSSFLANPEVVAEIHGTEGEISLEHLWFCPGKITLTKKNGSEEIFSFDIKKNGYEFEAEEVARCVLNGQTESNLWSHNESLLLVSTMDDIRKKCGVVYPHHDL